MDDLTLCFWDDLKDSKSFKGDNKLGASELVKKVAGMHWEFDSLKTWPSGHPAWQSWEVKLNIFSAGQAIHTLLTASGRSMGHRRTVLSGLVLEMLRLALRSWSDSLRITYFVLGLDTKIIGRHFFRVGTY